MFGAIDGLVFRVLDRHFAAIGVVAAAENILECFAYAAYVEENARRAFNGILPSVITPEQRRLGVKLISAQMNASGLTSTTDAETSLENFIAYQEAYQAGEMSFRLYTLMLPPVFRMLRDGGVRTGFGDEWLRVGGVKFSADGGAATRTMYMSTPYVGRPNDYGILRMSQKEIDDAVEDAHRHNFQIGIHANGDAIIDIDAAGD